MKRLCFDTESDRFRNPRLPIFDIEAHREERRNKPIRFDCAVVYDDEEDKYYEFTKQNVDGLVELLKNADEIISHSAPRVDFIVLEHACGEDRIAPLRKITHRDLHEIFNWRNLDTLTAQYIPERGAIYKSNLDRRLEHNKNSAQNSFIPDRLAQARYDVERTYAVYIEYLRRGR